MRALEEVRLAQDVYPRARSRQGFDALLLAAAVLLGIAVHYGDDLPGLSSLASATPWLFLHTVHLPFVVFPVSYAAWAFGLRGGFAVLALTLAGLSPHALMEPDPTVQALLGLHLLSTAVGSTVAAVAVAQWSRERSVRERNSSQLAASEHKYRALVEHNSEAIFLVDAATGNYLEVNPKACELTGYSREELLRMHVRQLIRSEDAPRGLAQASQTGFARRESVFVKKDGTEFIGIISITTFELEGRQVALGSLQDITETRRLQEEVEAREQALREGYHLHLHSLGLALDARNPYTRGHTHRVREYAVAVAQRMGLPEERINALALAAELHDYGKIGIADAILLKPGPLTPPEWAEIRRHPELTVALIEHLPFLRDARPIIRAHHEKMDGGGYPDALRGEAIPLEARIIGVVDAYDALTSARPYRPALSHEEAVAIIRQETGAKWDPQVVQAFLEAIQSW